MCEVARQLWATGAQILDQALGGDALPTAALHQHLAEQLGVLKRVTGRVVVAQVGAEDEVVGRVADPFLLVRLQLGGTQLGEGVDDSLVCLGSLGVHLRLPRS